MKRRSVRHILLATAAAAAGLVLATSTGSPASAAVVSQGLDCGIGGSQTSTLSTTAAATIEEGGTFQVTLAPSGPAGTASGAEIKNMVTTFNVPSNASIVAGSASASGGSGTLGAYSVAISGTTVKLTVPGPIANGASFVNPTLKFSLKATGAAGGTIKTTFRQSSAYTLTAAGSINVTCNATTPLTTLTSTTIQAAATTTTTTTTAPSTTTTTGGATTTTTKAPTTTTTAPVPTTTAPPTITTQNWSPGTACGVPQSTTAPANTISVNITAIGGKGGQSGSQASSAKRPGGNGGQAFGTFTASPGQTYTAVVGCNGANGQNGTATSTNAAGYSYGGNTGNGYIVIGQTGAGGGGGGASSGACLGADCASGSGNALVVAGGGGGGGVSNCAGTPSGTGGNGGNSSNSTGDGGFGPNGVTGGNGGNSGGGSNSILGGAGGVNTDLAAGDGGNAPSTGALDGLGVSVVGGGGGGGYAGGKQGQNANTGCKGAGGGGGGSSWVKNSASNATFSASDAAPSVVLTFTISTPAPTTTTTSTTSTTSTTTSTTSTTQPTTTTTTTTPCAADKVPFATVQALVTQQYLDFTGSTPTSAQNSQWAPAITNCSATADALIVSLLPTDQTMDDARLVRLYVAYFKRPPDPDGFAYWQRQLDNGKGLINAAKKFAESSEFKRTYGTLSNADFIELVYQNVLGRPSDPTGKAFWLTRLDNKTKNRGDVMINFSESSENVRNKVNHVQVFRMYRGMMQKFPSKTRYFELLNPILDNGKTLEDAAKAIRTSAEYDARV